MHEAVDWRRRNVRITGNDILNDSSIDRWYIPGVSRGLEPMNWDDEFFLSNYINSLPKKVTPDLGTASQYARGFSQILCNWGH